MVLSQEEYLRYSRHLLIPEVGLEGQKKLKAASVLLVGSGGLGSPVALYLAAAGVGCIGVVDYDVVDSSNLQRQVIHGSGGVGRLKVESARQRMLDLNPYIEVQVFNELFQAQNARQIAGGFDIVVDGTDNFPSRYLINDLCVLTGRPYVYGSIFRFEGQVSVFDARQGPCYRCLFPEPPPPGLVPACGDGGVFGVLPGTIGTLQATEVIKIIVGAGASLVGKLLLYDALELSFQTVALRKNPRCKICGEQATISDLIDYEAFCGVPANDRHEAAATQWDMEPQELAECLRRGDDLLLIDVREPVESQVSTLPGARVIPYGQLASRYGELDRAKLVVLFCRTGSRSSHGLQILAGLGFDRLRHLRGGINAWARQIDTSMYQY